MLTYIWRIGISLGLMVTLSMGGEQLLRADQPTARARAVAQLRAQPKAELLQLKAGGHVVGFGSYGWHLTNGQYALGVTFVNAASVPPQHTLVGGSTQERPAALGLLEYRDLWPGITLAYTADAAGIMRSTYTLAPQAQVSAIRLRYNVPVAETAEGGLALGFETGTMYESAPIAWQEVAGQRQAVGVQFALLAENEVGFTLGQYDPHLPVMIDPLLRWNTFLGGTGNDVGYAVVVDNSGNVYVGGYSNATWQGTTPPAQAYSGGTDGFVAKLNSNGVLQWNTFLGGTANDEVRGLDLDSAGNNIYVSGYSTASWGVNPVRAYSGGYDAFVASLSVVNGGRNWHTFLGGTSFDIIYGKMDVDAANNIYVVGTSDTVWGTPVVTHTAGANNDGFVAKLAPTGGLSWHTFFGSIDTDIGWAAKTDGTYVYAVGWGYGTWGTPVQAYSGGADGFLTRLNTSNGQRGWNTFFGGSSTDATYDLALGGGGVYVVGSSSATWGTPVRSYKGSDDILVARVLTSTGALVWNTFLGGTGSDTSNGINTDAAGNVYVDGSSTVTWGAPIRAHSGNSDAVAVRLDGPTGVLGWNTFLGANSADYGFSIVAGPGGVIHSTGVSNGSWGAPIRAFGGGTDVFVSRLTSNFETYLPMPIRAITMALPLSQSFNSGVVPPTNWSVVQTGSTTWVAGNNQGHWDTYGAYAAATAQNEVLMSPLFTVGTAQLKFYALGNRTACVTNNACDLNVWLVKGSGWGGGDDVLLYNAESDWITDFQWVLTTVNIPANFETVRVAIQYVNNNAAGVVIDDITVTP